MQKHKTLIMSRLFLGIGFLLTIYSGLNAGSYYVATGGSAAGTGSRVAPWNLQTALNTPIVKAGDTVWIAGGTYKGVFSSELSGREGSPIIYRSIPGETVVLDGNVSTEASAVLRIDGNYTWFWGLTISNSASTGSNYYKDGVFFGGANGKLINCIISNNGGNGIGFWQTAVNSEVYGCIIYHNGYSGDTRGHGHGIYGQNSSLLKIIRDNIMFHSYGIGIHIYSESGSIQGFSIEGNAIFNSGIPGAAFIERNILIGGLQEADRITITGNHIYNRPNYQSKASVQLGYSAANRNAQVSKNILVDGSLYVIAGWNSLQVLENTIIAKNPDMQLIAFDSFDNITTPVFNRNRYYGGTPSGLTFEQWKSSSGQDANSTYSAALPTQTEYHLIKNRHEAGRANIIVYNWDKRKDLMVDLSTVLSRDKDFYIYDVLNLSAGPIVSGRYSGGAIQIPLNLSAIEAPIRADSNRDELRHTLPDFGVFLVSSLGQGAQSDTSNPVFEALPLKIKQCHPNPTVDLLAIEAYSPSQTQLLVSVYDEAGKMVHNETFNGNVGDNKLVINMAGLSGGLYIVSLSDGENSATCKILKRDFALNIEYEKEEDDPQL